MLRSFSQKGRPFITNTRSISTTLRRTMPVEYTAYKTYKDTPMYEHESKLPNLPVPPIEQTAERYLKSARVFSKDVAATEKAVEEFKTSPLVKELQARLEDRAKNTDSWLADWWNEAAYFGWRGPVVPGVNYFYLHQADKAKKSGPARAASLLRALLYFRKLSESHTLAPELARKAPLAMASYEYLFNSSRIPTVGSDTAIKYDPAANEHVVVVRKNKFYKVPVVDSKGEWLSESELEALFADVVAKAGSEADASPLGALTTADRDVWTKARTEIIADPANKASLETIQSAIIVIALDSNTPITREERSWNAWVGDGQNRFFDKHQLIVSDNGASAFNGEHSCMDGTPTTRLNDWLLKSIASGKLDMGASARGVSELPAVEPLTFSLSDSVKSTIADAISEHAKTMADHDLSVLHYAGYGKELIKTFKVSPDSWAQIVMGLAYYRLAGYVGCTYESCQTRKFKFGRTEVIRSATPELLAFARAFEDPKVSAAEKEKLFRAAAASHIKLATDAADGQGVDRHLYGLKQLLKPSESVPAIYNDSAFSASSHWTLSTSQLSSEFFDGWGYGPVVDDGYGLAYAVNSHSLRFTLTSTNKGDLSVYKFRQLLEDAAADIRQVMEEAKPKL